MFDLVQWFSKRVEHYKHNKKYQPLIEAELKAINPENVILMNEFKVNALRSAADPLNNHDVFTESCGQGGWKVRRNLKSWTSKARHPMAVRYHDLSDEMMAFAEEKIIKADFRDLESTVGMMIKRQDQGLREAWLDLESGYLESNPLPSLNEEAVKKRMREEVGLGAYYAGDLIYAVGSSFCVASNVGLDIYKNKSLFNFEGEQALSFLRKINELQNYRGAAVAMVPNQ